MKGTVSINNKARASGFVIYKPKSCPNILRIKLGINITGLEKSKANVEPASPSSKPERYSINLSKMPI